MKIRCFVLLSILGMTSARERRRRTQTAQHYGKGKGKGHIPTKSPTTSPTKSPTTSPTKSPTAKPTPKPEVDCTNAADNDSFTFELMWQEGEMRPCDWLCWNPAKTEERKERYCGKNDVAANCSVTCGICAPPTAPPTKGPTASPTKTPTVVPTAIPSTASPTKTPTVVPTAIPSAAPSSLPSDSPTPEPTDDPTTSPTSAPTPCGDSSTFTFEMINYPDEERDCAWITSNPDRVEYRQKKYCGNDDVAEACQFACELCPGQTPFPTKAPTKSPTVSPTTSPTVSPTICVDDETFEFEMINFPGEMRDCKWICWRNIEERRANYCGDDDVASACPAACGLCIP